MDKNRQQTIGVFGHFGNRNLGDEAIIQAVIENCRRLRPEVSICCFSADPEDTASRHGVPSYPISRPARRRSKAVKTASARAARHADQQTGNDPGGGGILAGTKNILSQIPVLWPALKYTLSAIRGAREIPGEISFLLRSQGVLKKVDLLMISGSNQFLDNFGGAWGFPYTILKWNVLARISGTRVAFVSVGAGPLESGLGKRFVRLALSLSDYHSFRDQGSRQLIRAAGCRDAGAVFPDLAFSLTAGKEAVRKQRRQPDNARPVIGINPMPYCDSRYWPDKDPVRYREYIGKFAEFSSALVRSGYPLFFFPTQKMDSLVIADIVSLMDPDVSGMVDADSLVRDCSSVDRLLEIINQADMVIATRFHGVLLSLFSSIPTIAICYGSKTDELMHEFGQGEYSHPLETFRPDTIVGNAARLEPRQSEIAGLLQEKKTVYARELDRQYREILRLLD